MPGTPAPARSRPLRVQKRLQEIQSTACRLVIAHGYDGFTMDQLAEAVGVSRRTLFNYVADKESAVLGSMHEEAHPAIAVFRDGGPNRRLIPDLVATIDRIVDETDELEPCVVSHHRLVEAAIAADPKVLAMLTRRFINLTQHLGDVICEREGWARGDLRARALATTMLALIKLALEDFAQDSGQTKDLKSIFHAMLEADGDVRLLR